MFDQALAHQRQVMPAPVVQWAVEIIQQRVVPAGFGVANQRQTFHVELLR